MEENYKQQYDDLIKAALSENRGIKSECGYEIHHILPKCKGGNNNKDNLVKLTLFEHIKAHYLLALAYPEEEKLLYAFSMTMRVQARTTDEIKNITEEELKNTSDLLNKLAEIRKTEKYKIELSQNIKKHYDEHPLSEERRKQMSESAIKRYNEHPELKEKISNSVKKYFLQNPMSEKTKIKMSESRIGKKKSDSAKENLKKSWTLERRKQFGISRSGSGNNLSKTWVLLNKESGDIFEVGCLKEFVKNNLSIKYNTFYARLQKDSDNKYKLLEVKSK